MPSSSTLSERPRVLLVDDNQAMLARADAVLTSACVVVGTRTNGPAALEAARALVPDVIVLDISMPGMTGLEVAESLRHAGSKAAVVFLTVHEDEEFILAAQAVGGIGYVAKARLGSDLIVAVREASAGRPFVSSRR
ncbi:MAG: response regulator transcription factor [Vicinamibacterales bacterium]